MDLYVLILKFPGCYRKWIWIALICANAYALYNIFIKKGSASINPILGGVILQYIAALFGSCLLGFMLLTGKDELECDKWGIIWSICAGFSVGCAEMLSFVVSGMGVQATQSIPTIIGGSVMFGAVLCIASHDWYRLCCDGSRREGRWPLRRESSRSIMFRF